MRGLLRCFTLTEKGGSDLANLKTTARKTDDGRAYIINGHKVRYIIFVYVKSLEAKIW